MRDSMPSGDLWRGGGGSLLEAWGACMTHLRYLIFGPRRSSWYVWPRVRPEIMLLAA